MTVEIPIPLILNWLQDGNGGGKRRIGRNGGGPSFNKFRMSGIEKPPFNIGGVAGMMAGRGFSADRRPRNLTREVSKLWSA